MFECSALKVRSSLNFTRRDRHPKDDVCRTGNLDGIRNKREEGEEKASDACRRKHPTIPAFAVHADKYLSAFVVDMPIVAAARLKHAQAAILMILSITRFIEGNC